MISKNAARPSILHVEGRLFHLRQFRSFVVSLWTPDLRLALLLCIPGVAVAIALRLWLLYPCLPASCTATPRSNS